MPPKRRATGSAPAAADSDVELEITDDAPPEALPKKKIAKGRDAPPRVSGTSLSESCAPSPRDNQGGIRSERRIQGRRQRQEAGVCGGEFGPLEPSGTFCIATATQQASTWHYHSSQPHPTTCRQKHTRLSLPPRMSTRHHPLLWPATLHTVVHKCKRAAVMVQAASSVSSPTCTTSCINATHTTAAQPPF